MTANRCRRTLVTEVGFATGDQVEQQVRPRDTLPLRLYWYIPCISIPLIAMGLVGWEAVSERVGLTGKRHRSLRNDEGWQWGGLRRLSILELGVHSRE